MAEEKDKNIIKEGTEAFNQFTSDIKGAIDSYTQPRTELAQNQFYYYPMELNGTAAETGLPL